MTPTAAPLTRNDALALDAQDELAPFRERFYFAPDEPGALALIYLDGNSLGRLPLTAALAVEDAVRRGWGERLIRSWGEGWLEAPTRAGESAARLLGAAPGQVILSDSTSVNLYKLAVAALQCSGGSRIVTDALNFPSDLYILQGVADACGASLAVVPAPSETAPDLDALYAAIDASSGALVCLSHVAFKSGYLYPAAEITRRAHAAGALVLWDLSHSAGVVPIALDAWKVDFAAGCTYKYLNGGPGAPAFLYVRRDLQEQALSPIRGWFGEAQPFAFDLDYHPAPGINRFLTGTPAVLSLLALEPGLALTAEAGLERIRTKSTAQTGYLIDLFDAFLAPLGFTLGSPRSADQRGSHVSLRHPEGYRINRALIEAMAVLPDFREPDNLRLGIAPLYTTYVDLWEAVQRITRVVEEQIYTRYPLTRQRVT